MQEHIAASRVSQLVDELNEVLPELGIASIEQETDKPGPDFLSETPFGLIDLVGHDESFSAGRWAAAAGDFVPRIPGDLDRSGRSRRRRNRQFRRLCLG